MGFGNYEKMKRIRKVEAELKILHNGIRMFCSNENCKNTVVLKPEEAERTIMCSKCHSGFFVKEKIKSR